MKTEFTKRQLRNDNLQMANDIFRRCVHCGLCTATCSSYVVAGDERDSPRGRIYMIKEMLETGSAPDASLTHHMDRCLTCLSCMTTCPSGVDYMHLSDLARVEIEKRGPRPFRIRFTRGLLSSVMPYPRRFAVAMSLGRLARPFRPLLKAAGFKELAAMLELVPKRGKQSPEFKGGGVARPRGQQHRRVLLMTGCAQKIVRPAINDASIRLMARQGIEVIVSQDTGCCGALDMHMGRESAAIKHARRNLEAWQALEDEAPLDGIIINASGCGTSVKDYPHLLQNVKGIEEQVAHFSAKVYDISEFLADYNFGMAEQWTDLNVALHLPCSMMHGQKISYQPMQLLQNAGFNIHTLDEAHICCGSAGTYNILQPDIANELGQRKAAHIARVKPDVVATGNLGCLTQMGHHSVYPVVHFVELLDWAYGGPCPDGLEHLQDRVDRLAKTNKRNK
ncbi:MAG: glycolate oxidase iron-sulfur subunit [Rhodomicrobium sp.]|nr:MAG: glycolate oxidase iron-sulfur subunit [Rhodomicrobium sp.]